MISPTLLLRTARSAQPTTWLLLSGFVSLCAAGALIVLTSAIMLRSSSERMTNERLDANMRLAWHIFDELGTDLHVNDGRMFAGVNLLDDRSIFFRDMSALAGGATAVFLGDFVIGSTLHGIDDQVTTDLRMDDPAVRDTVLGRHERFHGLATVLGQRYYATFDPILGHDGAFLGSVFVGIPEAEVKAAVSRGDAVVVGVPLIAVLLVGSLFLVGGRRLARLIAGRQRATDEARTQLDMALASMGNGLSLWSAEHKLVLFNPRLGEILMIPPESIRPGMTYEELFRVRHAAGCFGTESFDSAYAVRVGRLSDMKANCIVNIGDDGRIVSALYRATADGGFVLTYDDVTEQHAAAAKIEFMAHYDALTGLGNRVLFDQRLREALNQCEAGQRVAVLGLDLDRFKAVNDTLGHAVGDKLLVAVGKRLSALLLSMDTLARLGGDEFGVVLPLKNTGIEACHVLADRIVRQLSLPFRIDGQQVLVGVSIGIAISPDHGVTTDELLRVADIAMYHAKGLGRGQHCLFDPAMDAVLQKRRALERDLRDAIESESLALHYQPLVCCATGDVEGYEALLRWTHPDLGPISPTVFVPLAEETNLILPLGLWVLETACRAAVGWAEPARVAVNLSPAQFRQPDLTAVILDTLARTGLPPARLEVEITEGVLIDDPARAMAMLSGLRAAGVSVSLDDFGTGYSSLSYLRQFPLDKIKIDKSFIDNMTEDKQAASIVQALVGLAHTLNLTVTAEGVETAAQLQALQAQSCNQVQGYLLGRPAPAVVGATIDLPKPAATTAPRPREPRPVHPVSPPSLVLANAE